MRRFCCETNEGRSELEEENTLSALDYLTYFKLEYLNKTIKNITFENKNIKLKQN